VCGGFFVWGGLTREVFCGMDGVHIDVRGCGRGGFMNLTYTKELFTLAEKLWNTMESIHVSLRTSEDFKSVLAEIEQLHRLMGGAPCKAVYEMRYTLVRHALLLFRKQFLPHVRQFGAASNEYDYVGIIARSNTLYAFLTPEFLSHELGHLTECRKIFRTTAGLVLTHSSTDDPGCFHWYSLEKDLEEHLQPVNGF